MAEKDFQYYKKWALGVIQKQIKELDKEEKEKKNIAKAFSLAEIELKKAFPVGTIRTWKGKKFIKSPDKKWRPFYEKHDTTGAKRTLSLLAKKINALEDGDFEGLYNLLKLHKSRFLGQGNELMEIYKLAKEKGANVGKRFKNAKDKAKEEKPKETEPKKEEKEEKKEEKKEASLPKIEGMSEDEIKAAFEGVDEGDKEFLTSELERRGNFNRYREGVKKDFEDYDNYSSDSVFWDAKGLKRRYEQKKNSYEKNKHDAEIIKHAWETPTVVEESSIGYDLKGDTGEYVEGNAYKGNRMFPFGLYKTKKEVDQFEKLKSRIAPTACNLCDMVVSFYKDEADFLKELYTKKKKDPNFDARKEGSYEKFEEWRKEKAAKEDAKKPKEKEKTRKETMEELAKKYGLTHPTDKKESEKPKEETKKEAAVNISKIDIGGLGRKDIEKAFSGLSEEDQKALEPWLKKESDAGKYWNHSNWIEKRFNTYYQYQEEGPSPTVWFADNIKKWCNHQDHTVRQVKYHEQCMRDAWESKTVVEKEWEGDKDGIWVYNAYGDVKGRMTNDKLKELDGAPPETTDLYTGKPRVHFGTFKTQEELDQFERIKPRIAEIKHKIGDEIIKEHEDVRDYLKKLYEAKKEDPDFRARHSYMDFLNWRNHGKGEVRSGKGAKIKVYDRRNGGHKTWWGKSFCFFDKEGHLWFRKSAFREHDFASFKKRAIACLKKQYDALDKEEEKKTIISQKLSQWRS